MGAAPKGESATLTTRLRYAYRYVRDARELRQQVGALSATFPIENPRSLAYYSPGGADLGRDRAVIRDALGRVGDTDTVWDLHARWGAYTAYLGQVCEQVVTLAAPGRGEHLRRVDARNDGGTTVLTRPEHEPRTVRVAGLADPTVIRVAGPLTDERLPASTRLVYARSDDPAATADQLRERGYRVTRIGPAETTVRAER